MICEHCDGKGEIFTLRYTIDVITINGLSSMIIKDLKNNKTFTAEEYDKFIKKNMPKCSLDDDRMTCEDCHGVGWLLYKKKRLAQLISKEQNLNMLKGVCAPMNKGPNENYQSGQN